MPQPWTTPLTKSAISDKDIPIVVRWVRPVRKFCIHEKLYYKNVAQDQMLS